VLSWGRPSYQRGAGCTSEQAFLAYVVLKINTTEHPASRIFIKSCSKMAGGRGDIGEIFRAPGRFGHLACSIRYMDPVYGLPSIRLLRRW
jgi:hypothetical protein